MSKPSFVSLIPTDNQPKRARVEVLTAGANRGARLMQPAFEAFNRASGRFELAPIYTDPVPERAVTLAREAAVRGVSARAIEGKIEEVLPAKELKELPLILSVDNPEAIASALEAVNLAERAVLIYVLIRMPNEELIGFRAILQANDVELQREAVRFFRELALVTARSGAAAVLGAQGRAEHLALEMAYRRWFADHMNANLAKIVAGIRPESEPFEITRDGVTSMALFLRESRNGWADPAALAREVVERPSAPISRGEDFAVAEMGQDGVRLHVVRLRATDGKAAIGASAVIDAASYEAADDAVRERAVREAAEAIQRAERQTISRTRPVFTTD